MPPRSLRSLPPKGRHSALRAAGRALMAVWTLGINHTTAPLDLRGRFAYAIDQVEPTLRSLRESLSRRHEATILSTCNRTEIYCAGEHSDAERTLEWLAQSIGRGRCRWAPGNRRFLDGARGREDPRLGCHTYRRRPSGGRRRRRHRPADGLRTGVTAAHLRRGPIDGRKEPVRPRGRGLDLGMSCVITIAAAVTLPTIELRAHRERRRRTRCTANPAVCWAVDAQRDCAGPYSGGSWARSWLGCSFGTGSGADGC